MTIFEFIFDFGSFVLNFIGSLAKIVLTEKYDILSQSSGHSHPVGSSIETRFDFKATAM